MSFRYAENLTKRTVHNSLSPWDFKAGNISENIRQNKESRQEWYMNPETSHYFYTLVEAENPNQRVSTANPPRLFYGLVVDYDSPIPRSRIDEAVTGWKIKPSWVDRSLGGGIHVIWLFSFPLLVDEELAELILKNAEKWLNLRALPGLDAAALSPFKLFCLGDSFWSTGHPPVDEAELQTFFFKVVTREKKLGQGYDEIPLDMVEAALRDTYPNFSWPSKFELDTQGPTFWIPESTSSRSAVVKAGGMYTFAAHAIRPFYSWADLLGKEFVHKYEISSLLEATKDIWWDGKVFWGRAESTSGYVPKGREEMITYFKVRCGLFANRRNSASMLDKTLDFIYNQNRIEGAAPMPYRPTGIVTFLGKRVLNKVDCQAVKPSETDVITWGKDGEFPFLSQVLDNLFDPPDQLPYFLAWWRYGYEAMLRKLIRPGQSVVLIGGVGVGKTLIARESFGRSLGGFVDASDYLIHGLNFNAHLLEAPVWCVDDDNPTITSSSQKMFAAAIKRITANLALLHNKKFETSCMTEWGGRLIVTLNGSNLVGPLERSALDKVSLFRCVQQTKVQFPSREEVIDRVIRELPNFLRWLTLWTPPDKVARDTRYGYTAYHEKSLASSVLNQGLRAALRELMHLNLKEYFSSNPEAVAYTKTGLEIMQDLNRYDFHNKIVRDYQILQEHLLEMARIQDFGCSTLTQNSFQLFTFPRQ